MFYPNRSIWVTGTASFLWFAASLSSHAQETGSAKPIELEVLRGCLGVWDAEIEVWPAGPGSPSVKFKGVETNRPYGEYWIASDFDSEYSGETMKIHSIVGYDLDKKKMAGMVIDHGPYAATMTGEYDPKSKTVAWMTSVKAPDGKPIVQKTVVTQKSEDERVLRERAGARSRVPRADLRDDLLVLWRRGDRQIVTR